MSAGYSEAQLGRRIVGNVLAALMWCFSAAAVVADEAPDAAAFRVMDEFLKAFNAKDAGAWADTLHYPHVRLASGKVAVYPDKASFVAAMNLEQFAAASGWAYSTWDERKVVQSSPDKVHVSTLFSRHKADGSVYESFQSLYIIEKVDGRWAVRARSSFAP
jgi:hypothetical protein